MRCKIPAVILTGAVILLLAGCSRGGSISPAELYAYAEDSGAVVFDNIEDVNNSEERLSYYEQDGVALYLSVSDLLDALEAKRTSIGDVNEFINDDMDEITLYMKRNGSDEQTTAMSASFTKDDDAEDLYYKFADQLDMYSSYGAHVDEGTEGGIEYKTLTLSIFGSNLGMGVYLDDNMVLIIMQSSSGDIDEYRDICEYLNIPMQEE